MDAPCRILMVEDDSALAELLQEYLSESDYHITLHASGDAALEHLKREQFDLVLSDIVLPGVDGISLLRHVTSAYTPEQTLVLLMTGYSGIDDALNAVEKGAYDFVSKPFRLPEIRVRLDNAVRYQRLLRLRQSRQQQEQGKAVADKPVDKPVEHTERRVGDRRAVQAYIRTEAA